MSGRGDDPLTPDQIATVEDESIDFSDIPELDDEFWEQAVIVEPDRTDQITMRVKRSVLAYFKAPGKGPDADEPRTGELSTAQDGESRRDRGGRESLTGSSLGRPRPPDSRASPLASPEATGSPFPGARAVRATDNGLA